MFFLASPILLGADGTESAGELANKLREHGIHPLIIAGFISMIPIFELRAGIPVGIALFKLNPLAVCMVCILFNIVPVLPVLLLLNPARRLLEHLRPFKKFLQFFTTRALKNRELIERYEEFGLALFVGIPLPVTGAWTGSLIAVILNLSVIKSFLFISLGVLLAGVIVTLISLLGIHGIIAATVILTLYGVVYLRKVIRKKNTEQR
jgi:uncharacterized membrane protein